MTTSEITRLAPIEGGLAVLGNPNQMLKQAQEVAELLVQVVEKQELFQKIGTRRHLYVEAWQFLAHFYGISAKIVSVEPCIDELTGAAGFKATADALMISNGQVISSATSMCLNNEDNWNMRPKYEYEGGHRKQVGSVHVPSFQLASMAQTRAVGKVLSNVLRFVVALAGFAGTPAEDMTGDETDQWSKNERPTGRDPERKSNGSDLITEPQRKRLFAIAKEVSCPMNTVGVIIQDAGFDVAANISKAKYDGVVKAIQEWESRSS